MEAIAQVSPGITDDEVLRKAAESSRVLVTADKDFGNWSIAKAKPTRGWCFAWRACHHRKDVTAQAFNVVGDGLLGGFTVVEQHALRVRQAIRRDAT